MSRSSRMQTMTATALGALLLASPMSPALAQSETQIARTDSSPSQRLSMGVGKSVIIDLPRDASEIFVGNPAVANAVVRSPRKLYVIGVANGQTTIFAIDGKGAQIAKIDINIGRDVGELQRILRAALPTSDISARTVEDSIILTGTVATAGDAQRPSTSPTASCATTPRKGPPPAEPLPPLRLRRRRPASSTRSSFADATR